jgi:hypothetical protein
VAALNVEQYAARFGPKLRRAFLAAVEAARGTVPLGVLADAIARGVPAVAAVIAEAKVPETIRRAIEDALVATMQAAAIPAAAAIGWKFGLPDPVARDWVFRTVEQERWLRFGADAEWRAVAEQTIRQAFMEGGHPYQTARIIRDGLGLNAQQLRRLAVYEQGLDEAGMSERVIAEMGERFRARLLRERAETISRTETIRAARQGQREAWDAAVDEGLLERDRTFRVWIADSNACAECQVNADASPIPYDAEWPAGSYPHPNCECSEGLSFAEEKRRIVKPLGEFPDWDACVTVMTRRLGSKESAERYCGKLESLIRR